MTLMKPLEVNFEYTQETPTIDEAKAVLSRYTTAKDMLKNIFVFVQDTRKEHIWLITPLHISKKEKKDFRYFNRRPVIKVQTEEAMRVIPYEMTYDVFKTNLELIVHKINNRGLAWSADKNEAILQANNMSYIFNQIAVEIPTYESNKVEAESLYDVLNVVIPSLNDYIEQFESETR